MFVFVTLCLVGAIALRWFTRTDHLTALLIDKTRSAIGAELAIGDGAHYELWPKLHLVLPNPSLKASASPAFARADSLEVTLPLRTLWADRYDIERVRLIKPTLDLDALGTWSNAQPPSTAAPPDVRFSLHIDDGTVTAGGKPVAQGVTLDFASAGDVAAWLTQIRAQANVGALIPPLSGTADAAVLQIGSTRLEGVHVEVRDDTHNRSAKP
ncbi:MAG: hypothetical protein ABIS07_12625 [Dokdonella sp.]